MCRDEHAMSLYENLSESGRLNSQDQNFFNLIKTC